MTSTYAIISVGGKQYRVREGERLLVDRLKADEGKSFHPDVLFLGGDGGGTLAPKTQVTAKVVAHVLGDKVRIGKRRAKTGYRKQTGFRASLSQIEIESIGGTARGSTARREAPAPMAEEAPTETAEGQPPRGYADFTVADITEKSKRWRLEQLEASLKFEKAHAKRKGAIAALEHAIATKKEKAG